MSQDTTNPADPRPVADDAAAVPSDGAPGPAASDAPRRAGTPIAQPAPGEIGGPKGPEPTRFGDWEQKGRATDF